MFHRFWSGLSFLSRTFSLKPFATIIEMMHSLLSSQRRVFAYLNLAHLGYFLVIFWPLFALAVHSAPSSITEHQAAAHFASGLTDDLLVRDRITEGVLRSGLHGSPWALNDTRLQIVQAGLACYISSLIFETVHGTEGEGYVDASDAAEYTNRTEVNWYVLESNVYKKTSERVYLRCVLSACPLTVVFISQRPIRDVLANIRHCSNLPLSDTKQKVQVRAVLASGSLYSCSSEHTRSVPSLENHQIHKCRICRA